MFVYVLACIFIYSHIFPLFVDKKSVRRTKGGVSKVVVVWGGGNGLLQSECLLTL